jgi:hypothetical protein
MSNRKHDYVAIGLTHSNETLKLLQEILQDPAFGFSAEGTMMSGYELYVVPAMVHEAVAAIRKHPKIHIEGHQVRFYEKARFLDEGTRYDRLLDHYLGDDPERPSANGVTFKF